MMEDTIRRGLIGASSAFVVLLAFQTSLIIALNKDQSKKKSFWDLIITSDDDSFSISRLQIYLWTVAIVVGFSAVLFANYDIPDIPQNLYMLMGVNIAATVASTAINTTKNMKTNPGATHSFFVDIFCESNPIPGSAPLGLDLPRTQMFVWTIISLIAYIIMLIESFHRCKPTLPDIPQGLVVLMGLSHGAYLGVKASTKKNPDSKSGGDNKDTGGVGSIKQDNAGIECDGN